MGKNKRLPHKYNRETHANSRTIKLGNYIIVTDTKETEKNYFVGLRNSLPNNIKNNIVIKVKEADTENLVDYALYQKSISEQYADLWIVLDRDQVQDFDKIIKKSLAEGIKVGWSNPCIEIWFGAYFQSHLDYCLDSVSCCDHFSLLFEKKTEQEYDKADDEIYQKLTKNGDECSAITVAKNRHNQHIRNGKTKPSEMLPCTTVYSLVEEIRNKCKK